MYDDTYTAGAVSGTGMCHALVHPTITSKSQISLAPIPGQMIFNLDMHCSIHHQFFTKVKQNFVAGNAVEILGACTICVSTRVPEQQLHTLTFPNLRGIAAFASFAFFSRLLYKSFRLLYHNDIIWSCGFCCSVLNFGGFSFIRVRLCMAVK